MDRKYYIVERLVQISKLMYFKIQWYLKLENLWNISMKNTYVLLLNCELSTYNTVPKLINVKNKKFYFKLIKGSKNILKFNRY